MACDSVTAISHLIDPKNKIIYIYEKRDSYLFHSALIITSFKARKEIPEQSEQQQQQRRRKR